MKAHALSIATEDNFYWYDGLNQVTRHDRGDLAPSSGAPYTGINPATRQQQEIFTFDETGNWQGDYSQSPALSQARTHNAANQITAINGPTGAIQPAYDEVGNMTTIPKAGNWITANTLKWDAWNRLVKLTEGSTQITYAYDALTRRVSKAKTGETRSYYYDRQWRCVEERVSNAVKAQYVWSPLDRWTMIRRKRSTTGTLNETRYVLKDYLDPTAIVDPTGTVMERYRYDAFGPVKILAPNFSARTTSECNWNVLFHAEFLDEDSGLYNYGYRVYHPELGRWPSRDPIGEAASMNLYVFGNNDTVKSIDYLGLTCYLMVGPDQGEVIIPIAPQYQEPGGPKLLADDLWKQLKDAAEKAGYTVVDNVTKHQIDSALANKECKSIIYYNHGYRNGEVDSPSGSDKSDLRILPKVLFENNPHSIRINVVCCQWNKVCVPPNDDDHIYPIPVRQLENGDISRPVAYHSLIKYFQWLNALDMSGQYNFVDDGMTAINDYLETSIKAEPGRSKK